MLTHAWQRTFLEDIGVLLCPSPHQSRPFGSVPLAALLLSGCATAWCCAAKNSRSLYPICRDGTPALRCCATGK